MVLATRVKKLEENRGIRGRKSYFMLIGPLEPVEFVVSPYAVEFGGTGEKPFKLESWQEVVKFSLRPDVSFHVYSFANVHDLSEKLSEFSTYHYIPGEDDEEDDTRAAGL